MNWRFYLFFIGLRHAKRSVDKRLATWGNSFLCTSDGSITILALFNVLRINKVGVAYLLFLQNRCF